MPAQVGHYAPGDLLWRLEHLGVPLIEIDTPGGVSWSVDPKVEATGKGLGILKNTYYKTVDAPDGTFKIGRAFMQRADGGGIFADIASGSKLVIREAIAAAATTYTAGVTSGFISIYEIRLLTSNVVLKEGVDYTVNYLTGVITFAVALPEAAEIAYLATSKKNANLLLNGTFEDPLGATWVVVAGATISRSTTTPYAGTYSLLVTPAATGDGVKYALATPSYPGRTYRLRFRAKGTASKTLGATWNDGTTDVAMTPTNISLSATWTAYEFTFAATKGTIVNIIIKDVTATPAAFNLDEVQLFDDTVITSPMDAGLGVPITFNMYGYRIIDGQRVVTLQGCTLDKLDFKSANAYHEDVSGKFLNYVYE